MLTKEQIDRIQKEFKIPVDSENPGREWIVCLLNNSQMPSDLELRQISSFIENEVIKFYGVSWYYAIVVKEEKLPCSKGHLTTIFRKEWENHPGWFYNRPHWTVGPQWAPSAIEPNYIPLSLEELMDRINMADLNWSKWKATHLEIFPPQLPS